MDDQSLSGKCKQQTKKQTQKKPNSYIKDTVPYYVRILSIFPSYSWFIFLVCYFFCQYMKFQSSQRWLNVHHSRILARPKASTSLLGHYDTGTHYKRMVEGPKCFYCLRLLVFTSNRHSVIARLFVWLVSYRPRQQLGYIADGSQGGVLMQFNVS